MLVEISDDDLERVNEIRNLPVGFLHEAIEWWNTQATARIKQFVVVTCYYEFLAMQADNVDDFVSWLEESEVQDGELDFDGGL